MLTTIITFRQVLHEILFPPSVKMPSNLHSTKKTQKLMEQIGAKYPLPFLWIWGIRKWAWSFLFSSFEGNLLIEWISALAAAWIQTRLPRGLWSSDRRRQVQLGGRVIGQKGRRKMTDGSMSYSTSGLPCFYGTGFLSARESTRLYPIAAIEWDWLITIKKLSIQFDKHCGILFSWRF